MSGECGRCEALGQFKANVAKLVVFAALGFVAINIDSGPMFAAAVVFGLVGIVHGMWGLRRLRRMAQEQGL